MSCYRRLCLTAVVAASALSFGCSYDFSAPFSGQHDMSDAGGENPLEAGLDAGMTDAAPEADVSSQLDAADASDFDAADASDFDSADASACSQGTKSCGGSCVSSTSPDNGCGADTCEPCSLPNATASCKSGACAIAGCAGAWVDCNGDAADGCETAMAALVPITSVTAGATAYDCCGNKRCSCNAVDGNSTTTWGSWECAEGGELCSLWFSFPQARLARVVVHHDTSPVSMDVLFGDDVVYSGAGGALMDVRRASPSEVQSAMLRETEFPSGGLWWTVSEVELYRCP